MRRHNDFALTTSAFLAVVGKAVIPFLITVLKTGAYAGFSTAFTEHVFKPKFNTILQNYKNAMQSRGEKSRVSVIIKKLVNDIKYLFSEIKKEGKAIPSTISMAIKGNVKSDSARRLSNYKRLMRACRRIDRYADALYSRRFFFDDKSRRASKPGNNQATLWEIRSVWKLRTGETLANISRQNYRTTVAPDGSVTVQEKNRESPKMFSATGQELDNLEIREFGKCTAKIGNPAMNAGAPSNQTPQYRSQVISTDNSKIVSSFQNLERVVKIIAAITATIAAIRLGPAVDTLKEANKYAKQVLEKLQAIIKKLKASYERRTA